MQLDVRHEPVRLAAAAAGIITAAGTFLIQWAQGGDWRIAAGTALLSLAVVIGGGEVGRAQAYAPATVDDIISAEDVIRRAERGDGG